MGTKKFLIGWKLAVVLFVGVLVIAGVFIAGYSITSGYKASSGTSYFNVPSPYSYVAQVVNNAGKGIFVPLGSGTEWSDFINHAPSGVSVCAPVQNGHWSSWGSCSTSCGSGTQYRSCIGVECGGNSCAGSASQSCSLCTGCSTTCTDASSYHCGSSYTQLLGGGTCGSISCTGTACSYSDQSCTSGSCQCSTYDGSWTTGPCSVSCTSTDCGTKTGSHTVSCSVASGCCSGSTKPGTTCTVSCTQGCSGGCFTANQDVLTPNGEVPISQIKAGDKVVSYNISSNSFTTSVVNYLIVHDGENISTPGISHQFRQNYAEYPLVTLTVSYGGKVSNTNVTLNHPYLNPVTMEYKYLKDFKIGDEVETINGIGTILGEKVIINGSSSSEKQSTLVYNLDLDGNLHNYIVNGVVVHNSKLPGS